MREETAISRLSQHNFISRHEFQASPEVFQSKLRKRSQWLFESLTGGHFLQ